MRFDRVVGSGSGERPLLAHPLWRREIAAPARLFDSVVDSGRGERPPPAHPLWRRETMAWTTAA
eukprot:1776779-Pyramimonas_sp.AAC.2